MDTCEVKTLFEAVVVSGRYLEYCTHQIAGQDPFLQLTRALCAEPARQVRSRQVPFGQASVEEIEKVRRAENKQLKAESDARLIWSRHYGLCSPLDSKEEQWEGFAVLCDSKLPTALAVALRDKFMVLWGYGSVAVRPGDSSILGKPVRFARVWTR